jgi:predicted PurR-regulated permease PerM
MTSNLSQNESPDPLLRWMRRVATVVVVAILLWLLSEVVLVIFTSILIAIALCGLANPITKLTRVPHVLAVLIATLIVVVSVSLPISLFGARLLAQYDAIAEDIPQTITTIRQAVEAHPWGRFVEGFIVGDDISKLTAPFTAHVASLVTSTGKVLSYVMIMLFGGIYLAMDPGRYINGLMYFTPANYKDRMQSFIKRSGTTLRRWLFTQLLVVVMNGVFAGVALWAFGVDAPVALAMLGGALAFIPYVGTLVAMAIGALAALPQGPAFALYAVIAFGAASFLEGYLITPYIQAKTLSLPPVIIIFSILGFTLLFGVLGVILAAPLTIVLMIALDTVYVPAQEQLEVSSRDANR